MSGALEHRMSAMRARLSHLSSTVDQDDAKRAAERRAAHHYYQDAAPLPPRPRDVSMRNSPQALLRERDANYLGVSQAGRCVTSLPPFSGDASRTETHAPPTMGSGVGAMLQLARKHASQTGGASSHYDPSPTSSFAGNAHGSGASVMTLPPPTTATDPLDFSGLHTYGFQERFPTSLRSPADTPPASARGVTAVVRHEVPSPCGLPSPRDSGSGHRYAQEGSHAARISNTSFTSDTSQGGNAAGSEASFDAFRAVQERLRNKMRQLTGAADANRGGQRDMIVHPAKPANTTTSMQQHSTKTEEDGERHLSVANPHLDFDDSSPPPRPPPSTREETATPLRSPERTATALASHSTTLAPALPKSTYEHRGGGNVQLPTPIEVELSGAHSAHPDGRYYHQQQQSRQFLHDSEASDRDSTGEVMRPRREYTYNRQSSASVSSTEASCVQPHPTANRHAVVAEARETRRYGTSKMARAPGAFSNPTSAVSHPQPRDAPPQGRPAPAVASAGPRGAPPASLRSASRSQSGSGQQGHRSSTRLQAERFRKSSASRRALSSSSSPSHPRERSSTGSRPTRSSATTTSAAVLRSKPISLNVEATILASVTGAELFALLRMRGLIDSEGDTEEYRLPPTRCHRLFVTADELRQLQLLRQSMHLSEEEQKTVPSYQRPTVAARSRNAEFAHPPPVTYFMER